MKGEIAAKFVPKVIRRDEGDFPIFAAREIAVLNLDICTGLASRLKTDAVADHTVAKVFVCENIVRGWNGCLRAFS